MARSVSEQAGAIFAFLRALQELRNRPTPTLSAYAAQNDHWVYHLDETPKMIPGLEYWGSLGLTAFAAVQGDAFAAVQIATSAAKEIQPHVLRIPKPTMPAAPEPPSEVGAWLATDFEDERISPALRDFIEVEGVDDTAPVTREELADHPEVQGAFIDWLIRWESWAAAVAKQADLRRLYELAFDAREVMKGHPEDWELVLGLGRLRLPDLPEPLDRHLLTVACVFDLDPLSGTLFVRRDDAASFRVEDEWIVGVAKPDRAQLDALCEELNELTGVDFDAKQESFVALAHDYRAGLKTDRDAVRASDESLLLGPSLILRKRGRRELIELLDAIEGQLDDGAPVPGPLQSLLEPGFGERTASERWSSDGGVVSIDDSLYMPLSLNRLQTRALEHADTRNATVIQGPPGTGKTRTIAVMVSHFLARGQRVLVVAETSQALREVRGQIPDEIRDLAVAKLGGGRSDKDDLQRAVNALNDAFEQRHDLFDEFSDHEKRLLSDIEDLHRERAEEIRVILDIRGREATSIDIEGYEGTPAKLTLLWLEQRELHAWIEDLTTPGTSGPQTTPEHIAAVKVLLREAWELPHLVRGDSQAIDDTSLMSIDDFAELLRLEASRSERESLVFRVDEAARLLESVKSRTVEAAALSNSEARWTASAIQEGLAGATGVARANLELVREHLQELEDLGPRLEGLHAVSCPATQVTWKPILQALQEQVAKKGKLKTSVTGEWKIPVLGGGALKIASQQLGLAKIKGKAPSTAEELALLEAVVDFDALLSRFLLDVGIDASEIPLDRQAQLLWLQRQQRNTDDALALTASLANLRTELENNLASGQSLQGSIDLDEAAIALQLVLDDAQATQLQQTLRKHLASLTPLMSDHADPIEREYVAALSDRDLTRFATARTQMVSLSKARSTMRSIWPQLAATAQGDQVLQSVLRSWTLERPDADRRHAIEDRLDHLPDALRWKRLGFALGNTERSEYGPHFRAVRRLDGEISALVRELARRRAWKKALDRIDANTISNMQRYALEQRKYGAGTGKRAPQKRREIRRYLEKCIPAIPAWIMPISEVARTFPRDVANFDVVIVDEASQAPLSALFLLALAKRAVIVGDHKQVSPEEIGLKVDQVEEIANRHLKDMDQRANWTNLGISLFDECKSAFAHMITLTEHRRCVPEIIGFSNEIAYEPEHIRLVPVRQTGTDALTPIETVFVPDGYIRGENANITNPPEADAIADRIEQIVRDPKCQGMTIGVITLQGAAQAEIIRKRVADRIDPGEYERRRLQFGNAPAFQGAERNIILLSMVAAPGVRRMAQTTETALQRYNVAMSRAKDQVILFHSLRPSELNNPQDLRRRLLEYCERQIEGVTRRLDGEIGLVPEDERVAPFDSLFEQRVHNRIVARGHKVIPQFRPEVEGHDYRIDLVVVGRHGKLAIECDGEFFHGGIEQFRQDQIRQEILESGGLRFFRIPESEFYSNPDALEPLWPLLDELGVAVRAAALTVTLDSEPPSTDSVSVGVEDEAEAGESEATSVPLDREFEVENSASESQVHRVAQSALAETASRAPEQPAGVDQDCLETSEQDSELGNRLLLPGVAGRTFPRPDAPHLRWLEPYHRWGLVEGRHTVSIASGSEGIWRDLLDIVAVEGPVLGGFLARRHYKAGGGSSLSANSEAEYLRHLKALVVRGELVAEDQDTDGTLATATFRLPDQTPVRTRVRGDRLLYDVPPRELAAIIRGTQRSHSGLDLERNDEEVFRRVLELLDFTKLTRKASDHLARIVTSFADELTSS